MARVIKNNYVDDRDEAVRKNISLENQIEILHFRIRELETQLFEVSREYGTPYRHRANNLPECVGRTIEQFEELEDVVKAWLGKCKQKSEILARIEEAPLKLRDKVIVSYLFGVVTGNEPSPYPSGLIPIGGPKEFQGMLRRMFGG
jgi:hypothetical protein